MANQKRGQLELFNEEYLERIELMRKLLWPKEFEMVRVIKVRHGNHIRAVRTTDLVMELRNQGITTLEDSIRWSDKMFGPPR